MFIDTHTHFDMILSDDDVTEKSIFTAMEENSISNAVQISTDSSLFEWSTEFSKKHRDKGVMFTLGIHPSSEAGQDRLDILSSSIREVMESDNSDLLFGIGECGLDFYRMHQSRDMQLKSFEHQINESIKWSLPLIVHSRDAMDATIDILRNYSDCSGIMHCFSGDPRSAKMVLDLGFYISFAGNTTFKKAENLHESAVYVPEDRILVETDAPFLAPVPFRGRKNRPEYIINTYRFIANLRKEPLNSFTESVYENFLKLKKMK